MFYIHLLLHTLFFLYLGVGGDVECLNHRSQHNENDFIL